MVSSTKCNKITAAGRQGGSKMTNKQINLSSLKDNIKMIENQENFLEKDTEIQFQGKAIYEELQNVFNKYLVLPEGADTALALWTLFTYGYDVFEFAPRLAILSPEPRCGKSTLLTLLEGLINNPLNVSNITPAVIYRSISTERLTLLLDEVDTYINSKTNTAMVGILNAGHRRNGTVMRMGGERFEKAQRFYCFCPVAMAGIGNIPDTLKDRSIIISLKRKKPNEVKETLRIVRLEKDVENLKGKCQLFMDAFKECIMEIDIPTQSFLNDRGNDNWEGLFKIAKFISEDVYNEALNASQILCKGAFSEQESVRYLLLRDIRQISNDTGEDVIESEQLWLKLLDIQESIWETYENKGLTLYSLALLLKYFGIKSHQIKRNGVNKKRYVRKDFEDAFMRYLPKEEQEEPSAEENE